MLHGHQMILISVCLSLQSVPSLFVVQEGSGGMGQTLAHQTPLYPAQSLYVNHLGGNIITLVKYKIDHTLSSYTYVHTLRPSNEPAVVTVTLPLLPQIHSLSLSSLE